MEVKDAEITISIMATADNGCIACVKKLFIHFLMWYPEHIEIVEKVWNSKFTDKFKRDEWLSMVEDIIDMTLEDKS